MAPIGAFQWFRRIFLAQVARFLHWLRRSEVEASMRRRLLDAWVTAERSNTTFKMKLVRGKEHLTAELIVTCSHADTLQKLIGSKLRKEHYFNGGVARSRFVLCDDTAENRLVAVFGLFGHFSEGAPFMQIAGGAFPEMESCDDWIVVSTETMLTSVPDEVEEEAARIAAVKAAEHSGAGPFGRWPRDGNDRVFVLAKRTGTATSDPSELRVNLYRDSFAASTREISVDPVWSCAICLGADGNAVRQLPCGHAFHGACIKAWLRRGQQCPLGRCPVPKEVLAALRRLMDFSLPETGAWPTLPQDVVKQDLPFPAGARRPGRLPHLRHSQGWQRFRANDFNAQILVQRLC